MLLTERIYTLSAERYRCGAEWEGRRNGKFEDSVDFRSCGPQLFNHRVILPLGGTGFYADNWPTWRKNNETSIQEMLDGTKEIKFNRSHEYGSYIVEAVTQHKPTVIYGNVRNTNLIDNLLDGCVEVDCLVDRNGIQPTHFGLLPEQLAALNRSHMAVHTLVRDALLTHNKEAARYALFLDPLSAAVCSPAELSSLFDEMWEAQREYLQVFE